VWADGLPNLVIGLREGLEIGLVVSILLAAVRKATPNSSTAPIWLGVLAATLLSLGFGAVLAFSRAELTLIAQSIFGGLLSLTAVVLVTWMIFWMRRTSRGLSGELRDKVGQALSVGASALAFTAFLAVAREGLETALFLWTTVQASGRTVGPLVGAAIGIGTALVLCWQIVRSSVRLNLGVFFARTAVLLVVIAAGVLSYGIGELQTAGVVPGHSWLAFDISHVVSTDSWWVSLVTGITNLTSKMTWLQVAAYLGYGATILFALLRKPSAQKPEPEESQPTRPTRLPQRAYVVVAVLVPLVAVGTFALLTNSSGARDAQQITVTASGCATDWTGAPSGRTTINVMNQSSHGGEIYLTKATDGAVIGEIEGLGPGTRRSITVDLTPGQYTWRCLVPGELDQVSPAAAVNGAGGQSAAVATVPPVTEKDLEGATNGYTAYIADKLVTLAAQTDALRTKIGAGDLEGAKAAWLPAQLTWERIGAAYGSFGDFGTAIAGLPQGLPGGTADEGFTGLHRVEFGLWHGQSGAQLAPFATKLHDDVVALQQKLPELPTDVGDLPRRSHEILEDALRRHLMGVSDQGAGAAYAETAADIEATNAALGLLAGVLNSRRPDLLPTAKAQLVDLATVLRDKRSDGPLADRQLVNSRISTVLETLSVVPTLLEVRAS
jgi:high-affinity iron transporter